MFSKNRFYLMLLVLGLATLACNLPVQGNPPPPPTISSSAATKIMLDLQNTALAKAATKQPTQTEQPPVASTLTSTPTAAQATPTEIVPIGTPTPTQSAPTQSTAADMTTRIKNAKILVYEDAGAVPLSPIVSSALDGLGLKYIHEGDALGNFMSSLNTGTQWDLIIVAAESRKGVQGEFWDVIMPKVTDNKTALIVEMWYLSQIANGRIQSLTSKCGIAFESTRGLVDSIYTLDTASPFFSNPNSGFSLTNFVGYWKDKGGDYVRLTGSGDAALLAGGHASQKSRSGMITSCIEGRVIIQTFSTHDYKREPMQMLWQNYITNTLTNHFNALP